MSVEIHFSLKKNYNSAGKDSPVQDRNGLYLQGTNGSTAVLIHGLTGTPLEMSYLAGFLHRKGYSVVCPRLANHGKPLEVLKHTSWQECYESVKKEIVPLFKNNSPVFVSGLSMGALLALLLAYEFSDRITGVSCLSPTLFYDGWNMPWSRHLLPLTYFTPLKQILYFKEEPPYGIKNEAIRAYIHKYYSKAGIHDLQNAEQYGYPYFPLTLFYQLYLLRMTIIPKLPKITVPAQFIQAEEDDMTSVRNSRFIYERIGATVKEMVLLKNSYHVITADQERDKVAQSLEKFFTRLC